jgi:hypothetical protein
MSEAVTVALITAVGGLAVAIVGLLARRTGLEKRKAPIRAGTQEKGEAPIRAIELSGRWHGERNWAGWVYDCTIHLQVVQSQLKGHINWTLNECPPDAHLAKQIGESGVEYVNGFLEGTRITLSGYQVDKPKLLSVGEYSLKIREDLKTFDGTATQKHEGTVGTLHGHAVVSR